MAKSEDLKLKEVIPTGIKGIDDYCKVYDGVYGLPKGSVGIIGGKMACGKTTLLTVMGKNFTQQKLNVLYVTVEDSVTQIVKKHYSSKTGISLNEISKLGVEEIANILSETSQDENGFYIKLMTSDFKKTVESVLEEQDIDVVLFNGNIGSKPNFGLVTIDEMRYVAQKFDVLIWGVTQINYKVFKDTNSIGCQYDMRTLMKVDFLAHINIESYINNERTLEIVKHKYSHEPGTPKKTPLNLDTERVQIY